LAYGSDLTLLFRVDKLGEEQKLGGDESFSFLDKTAVAVLVNGLVVKIACAMAYN
jgi:hypothetical protein